MLKAIYSLSYAPRQMSITLSICWGSSASFNGVNRRLKNFSCRAIQKKPDFAPARAHLGLLYVQMDRLEEAIPQLREALHIDPARSDASDALVRILQEPGARRIGYGRLRKSPRVVD